jgi:hypothetical protein
MTRLSGSCSRRSGRTRHASRSECVGAEAVGESGDAPQLGEAVDSAEASSGSVGGFGGGTAGTGDRVTQR